MRTAIPVLMALGTLAAQEPPPLSIKVDVNLVNTAFIVRDRSGALVRNLVKEDIDVFEDGVRQNVRFFGRSDDLPLRLAMLADISGSQKEFAQEHRRDIEDFIGNAISPRDRALLVCFGNQIRVASDFTSSASDMMAAFANLNESHRKKGDRKETREIPFPKLEPDGSRIFGTALFDAVYATAERKMRSVPGEIKAERKAIILFSDGKDNASAHDLIDAIEAAQNADSLIYTVRYIEQKHGHDHLPARNRYGVLEMQRLAENTGGASFDAAKTSVSKSLRQVADELRSLYDVGYVTTNPERDGSFRKVVIRSKRDGLIVRAKPGYYAR